MFPSNGSKYPRILAVAPSGKGMGFAVVEEQNILVAWGAKGLDTKSKNEGALKQFNDLLNQYEPQIVVLHDYEAKGSRRSPRIRELGKAIKKSAEAAEIEVMTFSREEVIRTLAGIEAKTNHDLAKRIAEIFPEEVASRLPPKRRLWESESARMDIFVALALAIMPRYASKRDASRN
jgi:hypothetical protein